MISFSMFRGPRLAKASGSLACLLGSALTLSACVNDWWDYVPRPGGDHGGSGSSGKGVVVTPVSKLAVESAEDYADNAYGIITGDTLKRWVEDFRQNRPREIKGNLVILQVVPSVANAAKYVTPAPERGVFSYLVPASSLNQTRDNGLSGFEQDIPDGPSADAFLKRYGLDPRRDLIVLTFEQLPNTSNSIVHSIGRAWLFLRYWGVDQEHIAILNGSVDWNAEAYGLALTSAATQPAPTPPDNGSVSVRDLRVDNTAIVIPLEEILAILAGAPGAPRKERVRIVDARGGAEALGLKKATSTGRTDCASYDANVPQNRKCSTPFEGRIKGARSVPWTQFLDTAENGFQFLSKAEVNAIFDAQSEVDKRTQFLIQYCRTNQRSTVTGIVASVILGYPTRFYETSFIEWGHIASGPTPNTQIVPEDFPFRTDLPAFTEHAVLSEEDAANYVPGLPLAEGVQPVAWVAGPNYNDDADISPVSPSWPPVDDEATTTALAVETDRAYLRGRN